MLTKNNALIAKLLIVTALMLVALPSLATTTWADGPKWVTAQENGGFYAVISVHGGDGGSFIDTVTMTGVENCDEIKVHTYDCDLFVAEGGMVHLGMNSIMLDPEVQGLVTMTVLLCDGQEISYDAGILPYNTVATEMGNWGSIKAQYR